METLDRRCVRTCRRSSRLASASELLWSWLRSFDDSPPAQLVRMRLLSRQYSVFQPQGLGDAGAVRRIGTGAIGNVPLLDVQLGVAHRPRRVLEQRLALSRIHLAEQVARLLPVIIVDAMIEVRRFALDRHGRLGEIGLVVPKSCTVGIVSERSAQIAVGAHLAVAVIALERAFGGIDRNVVEIDTEPVALGVAIGE